MANREQFRGHWNEVKGRLKEHWGQLTEDDLQRAEGSAEQLVGVVQQKTGATRKEVEKFLNNILGGSLGDQASETVRQYSEAAQGFADEAGAYAKEQARRLAAQSSDYSAKIVDTIRTRPTESLAIAFGIGIAAGALFFAGRRR
ncbi:hypothetical protein Q31b_54210 [Novipirellula aureliae]|uniref:CsbD-like domain-containing protein n=1 Tax=Novipirellula aureliae TaxID=2527966 RepID=A0A5C6DGL8_9BACT|nr:CsbD family protein [Novipirellula aureliae]TWU35325.1 hypothetical protein Q31b_54210 [Novipirellula aureliae]